MNIQWYPGHMTKAKRQMQEDLKLIDLLIELTDARAPLSSRNPDIDALGKNKLRLMVMNKADLADEKINAEWKAYFQERGLQVALLDSRNKSGMKEVNSLIRKLSAQKTARDLARGIRNRPVRAMVTGIPNVGKSTFINSFAGKACTRTGDKPGVTKGKQWIRLNKEVELLDTPGILWPKFEDSMVGERLSMTGAVNDQILNLEELSLQLIRFLQASYPGVLYARYQVEETGDEMAILEKTARSRGCLKKGDQIDEEKAARLILDDFRSGRLGRITLETPDGERGRRTDGDDKPD